MPRQGHEEPLRPTIDHRRRKEAVNIGARSRLVGYQRSTNGYSGSGSTAAEKPSPLEPQPDTSGRCLGCAVPLALCKCHQSGSILVCGSPPMRPAMRSQMRCKLPSATSVRLNLSVRPLQLQAWRHDRRGPVRRFGHCRRAGRSLLAAAFLVCVVVILLAGDETRLSSLLAVVLLAIMAPCYALAQRATTQEYAPR